ncbi:flavin monoamine oxidase family protein [Neorhizobium galegae]|uniref:flavin monoamine oxidase family protein n=1 Tax=Neorhizobium galegae TaxID=399 RepID=UPI002106D7A8|nr:FAD-dependent oxidoreductase [Neorhizobium galegae]
MAKAGRQSEKTMPERDAIVVGAGFTGLSAALELVDAGLDVLLLEARDRVGGKVESETLPDGTRVDTGGQFFCRDMSELMGLIEENGGTPVMTHYDGEMIYRPPVSPQQGFARWQGVDALRDRMIATDPDNPELAKLTVADWVARQDDVADDVRKSFLRLIKGLWCRAPEEVAFTWLASNDRRITNTYSEMEMFLPGSLHALADQLAARLGDRLRLGTAVTGIEHSGTSVTIMAGNERLSAKRIILALPPVMIRRIPFSPALPERLQKALCAWAPGLSIKLQVSYDKPFWREHGLSGAVMWHEPQGLYACDASHDDYAGLIVFVGGPEAQEWHKRPRAELIAFIREQLSAAFGPEGGNPRDIHVRDWVDDLWSGGAYSDVVIDLDARHAEDIITEGIPLIHFVSSELSPSYPGYVEGAIVAGRLAAGQVIGSRASGRTKATNQ